jgi:hypothetical protein
MDERVGMLCGMRKHCRLRFVVEKKKRFPLPLASRNGKPIIRKLHVGIVITTGSWTCTCTRTESWTGASGSRVS